MTRTWAVARHMIAEGLRMKIAMVFLVLIGLVVLGLPFSIQGDSSLTGAVQSFLAYGLSATSVLLGVLTIFMSRSLADELAQRQIFLVMTKPIPRYQYILGKWLGITVLNSLFLCCSSLTIYAMVHYIKHTHPPIDQRYDEAQLKNEVLVARHALSCTLPDFRKPAEREFQRNLEEGLYENVPDFNFKKEQARLANKYEARWRIVRPLGTRVFEFRNVLCRRSPDERVQIRYKTDILQYAPDEVFRARWEAGDPSKGTPLYQIPVRHVVGRFHTVPVPADAVAEDHSLVVRIYNENPFEGERQYQNFIEFRKANEVQALFVVGSFEWNLVRLSILILCKLMFLAAVAILMTTVFSYPVACLGSFTVYVLAGTRSFIMEALDFSSGNVADMFTSVTEFFVQSITYVYSIIHWFIPDFGHYDAVESLVNGQNVSLVWVLQAVFWLVAVKTGMVLGLAILLFHRREVAEISV